MPVETPHAISSGLRLRFSRFIGTKVNLAQRSPTPSWLELQYLSEDFVSMLIKPLPEGNSSPA
jgi:hypothetical protein